MIYTHTENFRPFIDPQNLEGKIGEVVTFTCGGIPNQPALIFILDREGGFFPAPDSKLQNVVLFPDSSVMVDFGPLTVKDDGDTVICIFALVPQVYFAAANITVLSKLFVMNTT